MAGRDPLDPTSSDAPVPDYVGQAGRPVAGMRVGIDMKYAAEGIDPEHVEAMRAMADILVELGAEIVEISAPDTSRVIWDWFDVCAVENALVHRQEFEATPEAHGPALSDLVLSPAMAFSAPTLEEMKVSSERLISGLHHFTCPFTMSGHPVLSMPAGVHSDGLPINAQLIAPLFGEERLIRAGSAFQSATEFHKRHPFR